MDGLVDVGKRNPDGTVSRSLHVIIESGDFVEVTVTADIMTHVSKGSEMKAAIHLRLEQIVQLAPKGQDLVRSLLFIRFINSIM